MNNLQKISGLVLIGVVGYFIHDFITKTKAGEKSINTLKLSQSEADKKTELIKKIRDKDITENGALTKYTNDLTQSEIQALSKQGYLYKDGKAVKK